MKLSEYIKTYKSKIEQAIQDIWDRQISNSKNRFLTNYYQELKDYFLTGGKRIRPLLCIATYNAFVDKSMSDIVVPSVGIEFLHNATLIHDDIIDKDDFRRGNPAFHYRYRQYHEKYDLKKMVAEDFGTNMGIIGGDSAFMLALEAYMNNDFEIELNYRAIEHYKQAFKDVSDGVLIEIDMVNQRDLSMEDYIEMIKLKTGALIEKSMLIGANYAKVEEKYLSNISEYALNLGIIFQIIDDILGTFGDEKVTGKPTDGDIREGKKTCLLIDSINKLDIVKRKNLVELIEKPELTDNEVLKIKKIFIETDVSTSCRELANTYFKKAENAITQLESIINLEELDFFKDLLNFVVKRNF